MKRFLLFALAVIMFAACSKDAINEQQSIQNIVDEAPETITVGFEGDETRIQLNSAQKTVWTKDDLVSVFYRSNANQQWKYDGETGARTAELKRVDAGTATRDMDRVVVVYPYNKDYYINPETYNVQASLPAVQNYLKDSYGTNGNIMISSSEYNQFSLKSVCGWLKLQLTGDGEVVKSITLRGNNGEQVAGELYINSADATSILASESGATDDDSEAGGSLIFEDTILKEVTLDCGVGVTLGAEATVFYIALPPQTFDGGITVEIATTDGATMTKSTDKSITIERNCIQPMAEFGYNGVFKPANNEIYYTNGSTTAPTAPYIPDAFGDATIQSNTYDAEKECWVITFDKDVTEIGYYAFEYCESFKSVTIPDSVTTIGYEAFSYCSSLTSVTIGNSVTTIGVCAFAYCTSLISVTIGNSVTTIGDSAFFDCDSLTSVTIPDSVTTIGYEAFSYCSSLTSVTIGNSVTTIGDYAFCDCNSLTSVTIGDSVTTIGERAFYNCESLTSVTIPDSVTTIGEEALYNCESLTSVTIGNSVTTIGEWAFYNCDSLKEFKGKFAADNGRCLIMDNTIIAYANASGTTYTIPDSVTTIGHYAFYDCSSLTSVTIGDSVTSIEDYAFNNCDSLKNVYCYATIPPSLSSDVFYGNASGRRIYVYEECVELYKSSWSTYKDSIYTNGKNCPDTTTIEYTTNDGNTITSSKLPIISNNYENGIGTLIVGGTITHIPDYAFYNCDSLASVTIPDSVTTIGNYAFWKCSSLTSVTIPDSVTTIGMCAFEYCKSLTSVTIPDSVTTIGYRAFAGCSSLTSVTIPDSVTTIGDGAFCDCDSLTSVTIPDSVTTIGYGAFNGCESLTSVTIPDSVTTIGAGAFGFCYSLTSVTIPDSVTTIGNQAFKYCSSLTSVTIPDSVTTIGEKAFSNCDSLTSVTIGNSVTTIGNSAFADCDSLTSVTIPDSVTEIGEEAFSSCHSLKEFKGKFAADGGRCLIMDNTIIAYAEALGTTYTIPDSVTTIGAGAFWNCDSLTSVTIPDSVTTIGMSAFGWCGSLKAVYCKPTTPPTLNGSSAFDYNGSGRKIYVPAGSVEAYKSAEYWSGYASAIVGYNFETDVVVE